MLRKILSQIWGNVQYLLFPELEEEIGPLTETHKKLISVLELVRIEQFVSSEIGLIGRPPKDRVFLARAFVAKVVYKLPFTNQLRNHLLADKQLRLICGWSSVGDIPSESKFSRAFNEFAQASLAERTHAALIKDIYKDDIVGHVSKDSKPIEARAKAVIPTEEEKKAKKKKVSPTRIERQASETMSLEGKRSGL